MTAVRIQVAYDYVDPGSYLATHFLGRWISGEGRAVEIDWVPLELSVPPAAPVDPEVPAWSAMTRAMYRHALEAEIPFAPPARVPRSRKAHELALHAHSRGCFESVHRSLFEAHFSGSGDIGRIDVLVGIAAAEGLDPGEVRTVLGVDRFRPEVERLREAVRRAGVRGVPTFESGRARLEGLAAPAALWAFLEGAAGTGPDPGRGGRGEGRRAPVTRPPDSDSDERGVNPWRGM